ncbi:helix-turn-helix domain-containing protein [Chryseobacterium gambrini]|uniref:helix-turn-helix domain-containing protein n=1 Tax=Chryseobacterium gambrini TaxID=373672 RepID=UPI0022F19412|nr:helix-turn-helix domain-containing protein [Chryseobacterium gambrini]WBV53792.1 helix-turn-helix domain-containing protein [Chryseobacterium gambrini]
MENYEYSNPDYKRIYSDILVAKFPHKISECQTILSKKTISVLDVIKLNTIIFGFFQENQKHRSYDRATIFEILDYQKKNKLNNSQLALHFKLSRSTIAKWRKHFV